MVGMLIALDWRLLFALEWVLERLNDWLSIKRKTVERGLIAGYVLGCAWSAAVLHEPKAVTVLFAIVALWMWIAHRSGDMMRLRRLLSPVESLCRVFCVGMALLMVVAFLLGPLRWSVAGRLVGSLCNTGFLYAIALPRGGGQGGRRRKLALEKIKAMFGTSWMPAPEGA